MEGLIAREARYVELATFALENNAGFLLELPGDVTAVVIAERSFSTAVEVDDPIPLSGPPVRL